MMPIVEDEGLRPRFHPLLLAGSDPAHSAAEARMHAQKAEAAWPGLQRLAASSFGIALEPVPWGARGATALAALLRVREQVPELEAAVWRAIFEARFMERADIDAPQIVAERLPAQAGIEAPDLDAEIEGEIDALRRSARDRAVTAVPTLIFSGGHAVVGAQPESVLRETLAQLRLAGAFLPSKNEDARSPLEGEGTPQD